MEGTVVLMEVMAVRMDAAAGAVGVHSVAVVQEDMIVGLTEVEEVDREVEEAWGKCSR